MRKKERKKRSEDQGDDLTGFRCFDEDPDWVLLVEMEKP